MKKFLLSSLLISAAISLFAGPVSLQDAQRKAEDFWKSKVGVQTRAGGLSLAMTEPKRGGVTRAESNAAFYIFTAPANGFVIVSADDRTPEILGYSTESMFDPENIPSNMRYWLDCYAEQISDESATASIILVVLKLQFPTW